MSAVIQTVLIGGFTIAMIVGLLRGDEDDRAKQRGRRHDRWWDWSGDGSGDGGADGGD